MATNKKSFILYCDLLHTIEKMPKDKAGELFLHILKYVNDLNPETDDLIINLTFEPIKQQLKRDLKQWERSIEDKSIGGKLGNLKRWHEDLYLQVVENKISIDEALKIASNRTQSHTDNIQSLPIASIAVNVNDTVNVTVNEIIDYLNIICKSEFKKTSKKTIGLVNARLKENYTLEDFKSVIDFKNKQWSNDKEMKQYLRPETLFGTKFESYLQAAKIENKPQERKMVW